MEKKERASSVDLCQRHKPQHPHHVKVSPWGYQMSVHVKTQSKSVHISSVQSSDVQPGTFKHIHNCMYDLWRILCASWPRGRGGVPRTQKLRPHSPSAENPGLSKIISFKHRIIQNAASCVSPAVKNSNFHLPGSFNFIFSKSSSNMQWRVMDSETDRLLFVILVIRLVNCFALVWPSRLTERLRSTISQRINQCYISDSVTKLT